MKKIKISTGEEVMVDDEDFEYLSRFNWSHSNGDNQVVRQIQSKGTRYTISMADFIKQRKACQWISYRNKNHLDLRKENIVFLDKSTRVALFSKRKNTVSIYRGVCMDRENGKWRAIIGHDHKQIHLGRFDDEKEAALAYNKKARELYGQHAYQNKI